MAVTQADLDALDRAILDGVRQGTLPGGQVTIYNTTDALTRARDRMAVQLQQQSGIAPPRRIYLSQGGRGYNDTPRGGGAF